MHEWVTCEYSRRGPEQLNEDDTGKLTAVGSPKESRNLNEGGQLLRRDARSGEGEGPRNGSQADCDDSQFVTLNRAWPEGQYEFCTGRSGLSKKGNKWNTSRIIAMLRSRGGNGVVGSEKDKKLWKIVAGEVFSMVKMSRV